MPSQARGANRGCLPARFAAGGLSEPRNRSTSTSSKRSGTTSRTPDAFEAARARLAYGERLRRTRNRVLAREQLRAAVDVFDGLDARPWTDRARAELAATAETVWRRDPSTIDELSPEELRIALLLAGGKTTRETAAALFLSPKTVEYHLRHVYAMFDIHSRGELARALAARTPAASSPAGAALG